MFKGAVKLTLIMLQIMSIDKFNKKKIKLHNTKLD